MEPPIWLDAKTSPAPSRLAGCNHLGTKLHEGLVNQVAAMLGVIGTFPAACSGPFQQFGISSARFLKC
jgi:hypothetical protein